MAQPGESEQGIVVPDGNDPAFPELIAPEESDDLGSKVASGAKWSMIGNIVTRAGSLLIGIVVANLLDPDAMGVFAVAMTVGQMLLIFVDMGLGTDLVRGTEEEMERKAPTLATLGLLFSVVGALALELLASPIAHAMKSPGATRLLLVYAFMVVLGGLAVVPQAILTRRFDQKSLFFATVSNFLTSNTLTIVLLLATSIGVLALPIGAAVGMFFEVSMFYYFTKRRPHFGWDRSIIRDVLSFGAPVAGSNAVQVLLGNVDRMVVAPVLGQTRLGFYTMASNVSNWPVSVFGIVVRSVAMPAFARTEKTHRDPVLTLGTQLTWLISAPVGLMLALFSHDVIYFLYGPKYGLSVPLLASLGIYGAIRVMFDTFTGYLYARSNSRAVLVANIAWLVAAVGITWVGAHFGGTEGAALSQLVTIALVALPVFLWAVHRTGGSLVDMGRAVVPATLACLPAGLVSYFLMRLVDGMHLFTHMSMSPKLAVRLDAMVGLMVGGVVFLAIYAPLVFKRVKASIAAMRSADGEVDEAELATA